METYVGDGAKMSKRIKSNHCSGNVEGSALRQHVAQAMGYAFKKTRRRSSTKIRIDLPNPRSGEVIVSTYIRAGKWQFVECASYAEAHDFQWYVIDRIAPSLNRNVQQWNHAKTARYEALFEQLINCQPIPFNNLTQVPEAPGVYLFHNENLLGRVQECA